MPFCVGPCYIFYIIYRSICCFLTHKKQWYNSTEYINISYIKIEQSSACATVDLVVKNCSTGSSTDSANAEPWWRSGRELPLLTSRPWHEPQLSYSTQGVVPLCMVHSQHGETVSNITHTLIEAFISVKVSRNIRNLSDVEVLLYCLFITV